MFYKKGVDITNDKQMFNFLKNHFEYYTLNSWNGLRSIANNVKIYNLGLSGDWCVALDLLSDGEYDTINFMIQDWARDHYGYDVYFNGRSGGYLVLSTKTHNAHILPDDIAECETYDEYKRFCKEYYGSVKANRDDLVFYTRLVQDFDRLCDDIRDFCDELSNQCFETITMQVAVEEFNNRYADDLLYLDYSELACDSEGVVDISEIMTLDCLKEAFERLVDKSNLGYKLVYMTDSTVRLQRR